MNWIILRVQPVSEFKVLHRLNQREHPAMVPYEEKWRKRGARGKKVEVKYALFPRYVFVGVRGWNDYTDIRDNVPEVHGVLFSGGRPALLGDKDIRFIQGLTNRGPTVINLHRAIQVGAEALAVGGPWQGHTGPVAYVNQAKDEVGLYLKVFNGYRVVPMPIAAVEAA